MTFKFSATTFVSDEAVEDHGKWVGDIRRTISAVREFYPELAHFADLPLGVAWGDFCGDVYEVSWMESDFSPDRDAFLDYCYHRQVNGNWPAHYGLEDVGDGRWRGATTSNKGADR